MAATVVIDCCFCNLKSEIQWERKEKQKVTKDYMHGKRRNAGEPSRFRLKPLRNFVERRCLAFLQLPE